MSVDLEQGLNAHSKVAGSLECIDAGLHEPRRRGMAHNVRTVLPASYRCPRTPQLVDWRAPIVHDMRNPVLAIEPVPAAQVGK
jgi:hypothetical protein